MMETTDREDQVNAAYKESWAVALAAHGVTDAWSLSKEVRWQLAENGRRAWEDYYAGKTVEQAAEKVAARRSRFETQFGISDKAPVRVASSVPARAASPAPPEPMDFGSADDVNRAVGALFGTRAEEMT